MKIFKKPNFNMKLSGFSEIRTHDPWITREVLYHCSILHKRNFWEKVVDSLSLNDTPDNEERKPCIANMF